MNPVKMLWRWLRERFDGTGPLSGVGMGLVALALLISIGVQASGTTWQLWNWVTVRGNEVQGVVLFKYHGNGYSVDDTGSYRYGPRTVYVDPADPNDAVLHPLVAQMTDGAAVGVPLLAGITFIGAGFRRRGRNRTKNREAKKARQEDSYGTGLDPELISRLLAERNGPSPAAPPLNPWGRPSGKSE